MVLKFGFDVAKSMVKKTLLQTLLQPKKHHAVAIVITMIVVIVEIATTEMIVEVKVALKRKKINCY